MHSVFIPFKNSRFHFSVFGEGKKPLLAFHGFGETAEGFQVLNESLGNQYTIYAMDFPFHGKTEWKEKDYFTRNDFQIVLEELFSLPSPFGRAQRARVGDEGLSLLGFSLGGKLAMSAIKILPGRVDELFLVAPDGIWTNRYYNLAVYPGWGRLLFKTIIRRPELFFLFIRIMRKSGNLSKFLYEFTFNHMDTRIKRQRLYDVWMSARDFQPDIDKVKQIIRDQKIKTHLFFGKYDQVIRQQAGEVFKEGLENCSLTLIDAGHMLINSSLNSHLANVLK